MKIALFGGTGFVGNYIVKELLKQKYSTKVLVRKGSEEKILKECEIVLGSIDDHNSIRNTIQGCDAIIYNIGIIREFLYQGISYNELHYEGVKSCVEAATTMGVKRFILMSANGVKESGTDYQATKWKGEEVLKGSSLDWTIFRPSLIFGDPQSSTRPEFCTEIKNKMLSLPIPAPLFYSGLLPLNAGSFCMSPIHVVNVAEFFVSSIEKKKCFNKQYNLGGLESYTWKNIIHKIAVSSNKSTWKIPAPIFVINLLASILGRFDWFPITSDQITMLMEGNIVDEYYFDEFGIDAISFDSNNLSYLKK